MWIKTMMPPSTITISDKQVDEIFKPGDLVLIVGEKSENWKKIVIVKTDSITVKNIPFYLRIWWLYCSLVRETFPYYLRYFKLV